MEKHQYIKIILHRFKINKKFQNQQVKICREKKELEIINKNIENMDLQEKNIMILKVDKL